MLFRSRISNWLFELKGLKNKTRIIARILTVILFIFLFILNYNVPIKPKTIGQQASNKVTAGKFMKHKFVNMNQLRVIFHTLVCGFFLENLKIIRCILNNF